MDSIFSWLIKYAGGVVTILTALALLIPYRNKIIDRIRAGNTDERLKSMEQAMSQNHEILGIVLHTLFFEACRRAINRGYTSLDELEDINSLYDAYKALNFNGYGDQLYRKVANLKTDKELFGSND